MQNLLICKAAFEKALFVFSSMTVLA